MHYSWFALSILVLNPSAARAQYDPDAPEPIEVLRGTVFAGGGGELPSEMYDRFIELAGGKQARLVVLAAKERAPLAAELAPWRDRSPAELEVLHASKRTMAAGGDFASPLDRASGVWIVGEDRARLAATIASTPVELALRAVLARGGVVGFSGAAVGALDLVPGAVLAVNSPEDLRRMRLLATRRGAVGFGIDPGTVMVLHRRFIDVLGSGSVFAHLAASEAHPHYIEEINRQLSPVSQRSRMAPRQGASRNRRGRGGERAARRWRPRRLADLLALSRSAMARTRAPFPAAAPPPPRLAKGALVIVGGGGLPAGLLERFIALAGGPQAPIVYIPCTEREELTREPGFLAALRRAGARKVSWIHTKDRRRADADEEILAALRSARGIWFGGGRQWNLVDSWQHTEAHRLMHAVLARGGVIGGSSAGASIQGSYMPRGNPLGNLDPMAAGYEQGLGFLTGVAIDQHFSQRGRLPDMSELMAAHPQLLGIGLDETAAIVVQGSVAEVVAREGRGVHFYDRRRPLVPGEPDHLRCEHGQRFDLVRRELLGLAKRGDGR